MEGAWARIAHERVDPREWRVLRACAARRSLIQVDGDGTGGLRHWGTRGATRARREKRRARRRPADGAIREIVRVRGTTVMCTRAMENPNWISAGPIAIYPPNVTFAVPRRRPSHRRPSSVGSETVARSNCEPPTKIKP